MLSIQVIIVRWSTTGHPRISIPSWSILSPICLHVLGHDWLNWWVWLWVPVVASHIHLSLHPKTLKLTDWCGKIPHRLWPTSTNTLPWGGVNQGLYSLSGKTSYRKISWSLEAARLWSKLFQSLWNLSGTSAALLPRCLSNFRAMRPLQHPISRLRDFTRFGGKTSYRLVNRGPVNWSACQLVSTGRQKHDIAAGIDLRSGL